MTKSEKLFEVFLEKNNIFFEKISVTKRPTPDYLLNFNDYRIIVEIKEIREDENFKTDPFSVSSGTVISSSSRTVGDHVRAKISEAKKQIQQANKANLPAVLLIYNNLDPWQAFGTEDHDFRDAILGEYTLVFQKEPVQIIDRYHGRNKSFAVNKNTSFSAVGRLKQCDERLEVTLFENPYAKIRLDAKKLSAYFEIVEL